MKNRIRHIFLIIILLSSFFHIAANPNPSKLEDAGIDNAGPILVDVQSLSFSDLGVKDHVQLQGPYQDYSLEFASSSGLAGKR